MASSLADRIESLRQGRPVRAFARDLGISEGALRGLMKGGSPTLDTLLAIASNAGVPLIWLATGDNKTVVTASAPGTGDFAMVPRLSVEASAGAGAINHTEETARMLAFPSGWLHSMGLSAASARVLSVRGDSMAPTLQHGDLLLVDAAVERVEDAGIYVVGVDDRILVKRIQPRFDGSLSLISENPVYSPEEIPAGLADKLRVLGRVRWYGRAI